MNEPKLAITSEKDIKINKTETNKSELEVISEIVFRHNLSETRVRSTTNVVINNVHNDTSVIIIFTISFD